jgi:type 1 glutamine amidotransferase
MSMKNDVSRRRVLQSSALVSAAFATGLFPHGWTRAAADDKTKKVLFFTKSSGFQHSVVTRSKEAPEKLALAEQTLVDLGKMHGFDVTVTKDGSIFTPEKLEPFDVIAFYTTGDLDKPDTNKGKPTEKDPKDGGVPMPEGGFDAMLKHIESGKGFVGFHCATDTFNHHGDDKLVHPYIKLVGAEFDGHNKQQKSKIRFVKGFAPIDDFQDLELVEEWYRFKNIAPDMQVIFVQETGSMEEQVYKDRKPYPETWARAQGKGRVFYSSMGHREDVWTNPMFQQILLGGLSWAAGNIQAEVKPNLKEACPDVEHVRKD